MYGIFTYIRVIFRANVGKYSIHGAYGIGNMMRNHEMFGYIPQLFLDSHFQHKSEHSPFLVELGMKPLMTGTIELGCLAGVGDRIIDYQIHGIDRYIDRLDKHR